MASTMSDPLYSLKCAIDSIDTSSDYLGVSLSSLEGNIWDGMVKVLAKNTLEEVAYMYSPCGVSVNVFVTSNNVSNAFGSDNGSLTLFSVLNPELHITIQAHDDILSHLCWNHQSYNCLFSCGWDGSVYLWDLNRLDSSKPSYSIRGAHYGHVNMIASSSDACSLVTVGSDGFARTWDTRQSESSGSCHVMSLHQAGSCATWDSSDPNRFIVGTDSGEVLTFDCRKLSDASQPQSLQLSKSKIHNGRIRKILRHPVESNKYITCSDDTVVAILSVDDSAQTFSVLSRIHGHSDYVSDIACISVELFEDEHDKKTSFVSASTDMTLRTFTA